MQGSQVSVLMNSLFLRRGGIPPSANVTPHPEEQAPARHTAVLVFPKLEVQPASVEQACSERRSKKSKGNL